MSEYELKNNPLSRNRTLKEIKKLLDESSNDSKRAVELYDYFKSISEDPNLDAEYVTQARDKMVDCLKLKQSSRDKAVRLVDLAVRLNKISLANSGEKEEKKPEKIPGFNELSEMAKTNDRGNGFPG